MPQIGTATAEQLAAAVASLSAYLETLEKIGT